MQKTNLKLFYILCTLAAAVSCEKKPTVQQASCTDALLNNGEIGVDCGGPCNPCPEVTTPIFFAVFNGDYVSFNNVQADYGDTISLSAHKDSISVNLRFKNLNTPDNNGHLYPIIPDVLPFVTYNNTNYTTLHNQYSVVVLTKNENQKISGLFQLYLPHGFNNMDTLKVINGTFQNIPY